LGYDQVHDSHSIHDHGMYSYVECSWTKTFKILDMVQLWSSRRMNSWDTSVGMAFLTAQIHGPNSVVSRTHEWKWHTPSRMVSIVRVLHMPLRFFKQDMA
jgi:hypothetical protein